MYVCMYVCMYKGSALRPGALTIARPPTRLPQLQSIIREIMTCNLLPCHNAKAGCKLSLSKWLRLYVLCDEEGDFSSLYYYIKKGK